MQQSDIAAMTALARRIVAGNTGYNQARRWAFYDRATDMFIPNRATDCSAMSGVIARAGTRKVDLGTSHAGFYTGNFEANLVGTGEFKGMPYPGAGGVREGDFLWKPGHVVYAVSPSLIAEALIGENGSITGGMDGNQNGRETRVANNYGGWTRLIRPIITTSEEDEMNSTEKKQLAEIHAALTSADGRKIGGRIRNIQDILTGYSENQYVKKGYSLPLIGARVRDTKDMVSGGGPEGQKGLLRQILAALESLVKKMGA